MKVLPQRAYRLEALLQPPIHGNRPIVFGELGMFLTKLTFRRIIIRRP